MTGVVQPTAGAEPFPHVVSRWALAPGLAERALRWMETSAPWKLRIASFYEQWEIHLDEAILPQELRELVAPSTIARVARELLPGADCKGPQVIEVTAHRMVAGQTIRIHNDFRPGGEAHRALVQLNRGWLDEQGGLLMLFGSSDPSDVRKVLRPVHGSGFGFEISDCSFHAVSTIASGERFTLVYTFGGPGD